MKSVVLCGSRRFKPEMRKFGRKLKEKGIVVYEPYLHSGGDEWKTLSEAYKRFIFLGLTHDHFYKIKKADIVFVYNKDGYIGNSTKLEIEYAKKLDKEVMYLQKSNYQIGTEKLVKNIIYKLLYVKIQNIKL